jgi:hypothetical protein
LISLDEIEQDTLWFDFIYKNIKTKTIYPPILRLKLGKTNLEFESYMYGMVKEYTNKFLEFIADTSN